MPAVSLKPFQQRAVESAVRVFAYNKTTLDAAGQDADGRATAIHGNGYILIEAPTGAGKTLMAGSVVEQMSGLDNIVWFWFAPFKGVVEQSAASLREQFKGMRLRTLAEDRNPIGTRAGDTFVTTWQMVATRIKDRRSVRQTGEQNESIDDLITSLREMGLRIGVVVDEAHHGFHGETQAAAFFRTVLDPDYTILVTATPDDEDLKHLAKNMQVGNIHRISVSRADAVGPGPEAGLIKSGIKAVAWRAEEGKEALVDFEATALREATQLHRLVKAQLKAEGIALTPLMLVQVDSSAKGAEKSTERAKEKLKALGFTDAQIAVHTSDEPDPSLLAIANDETREVLIFKMAVALGFDAPRAWTLVSMRAAKDEDFGVQLVGRILRVHRRLQGRKIPDVLKYGYVFLADYESQGGLDKAGQRINQIQTAYASVSPTTIVVQVGNRTMVQKTGPDGQTTLHPVPPEGAVYRPTFQPFVPPQVVPVEGVPEGLFASEELVEAPDQLRVPSRLDGALAAALRQPPPQSRYRYPLRPGVPRKFSTQDVPEMVDVSERDIAHHFLISSDELMRAINACAAVSVHKRTIEIFTQQIQQELAFAAPSPEQTRRMSQSVLCKNGYVSPKELRHALCAQLQIVLMEKGYPEAADFGKLGNILDTLIVARPEALREAERKALAKAMTTEDAGDLPDALESEEALPASRLNVYGRVPPGLNTWEARFGEYLDDDTTDAVLWWHRNLPHKPWSINVLMDNGRGFFPDFIVGIKNRPHHDHGLLADTKYAWDSAPEFPKLLAEHQRYGKAVILTKDASKPGWYVVGIDKANKAVIERPFRIAEAARY
ncbi:MAG: DEAD/DEAH box helicase family protein [Tepidisphaera sp.]